MIERKPLTQAELCRQLAPQLVEAIVGRPLSMGGDLVDVEVITEQVLVGVVAQIAARGEDPHAVFTRIASNARGRLMMSSMIAGAKQERSR